MYPRPLLHPSAKLWIEDRKQLDKQIVANIQSKMYYNAKKLAKAAGIMGEFVIEDRTLNIFAIKRKVFTRI